MKVVVNQIGDKAKERVVLECIEMTREWEDIRDYAMLKGDSITGFRDGGEMCRVNRRDIIYIEAVGELVFAYTESLVLELKMRLYEAEEQFRKEMFLRCSKSILLNLMKVEWIRPALNGRFHARMVSGEDIVISRQYAKLVKKSIMEDL